MTPLISVIVPIYNVEQYLDRCVESIVNQTYQNLEIILVNDGSTDSSGKKCDEWEKKDNRIVVIHKENGGLSDARNIGLKMAKGEFIGFIDSDDLINKRMYQELLNLIIQKDADIAECKWVTFEEDFELANIEINSKELILYSTEEALLELIHQRNIKQTVVNKLYRKRIITVSFPVGKINEDEYWTYRIIGNAAKVIFLNSVLYYYFQRSDSIMHTSYSLKRLDGVYALKERLIYVKDRFPNIYTNACLSYLWACFYNYQVICRNSELDPDCNYRKKLHSEYNDFFSTKAIDLQPLKQKIWMKCFYYFPNLTCGIRNVLKIGF